jgi:hypothetical protein
MTRESKPKPSWSAGKCRHLDCPITLVTYIGGGQHVCWLHALKLRLV